MNLLSQFHIEQDESSWDIDQLHNISEKLQLISQELYKVNKEALAHQAEVERQAILLNKSPEGLKHRVHSRYKTEEGEDVDIKWPNIESFDDDAFKHLLQRFNDTKNLYLKTEYGLVLFYSRQQQSNSFVKELLEALLKLSNTYIEKAKSVSDSSYTQYFYLVLNNALYISGRRSKDELIKPLHKELLNLVLNTHQEWRISENSIIQIVTGMTGLVSEYFKDFEAYSKDRLSDMNNRNWQIAQHYAQDKNPWKAINIVDVAVVLSRQLNSDVKRWFRYKAQQYERLAEQREGDIASISFIEDAMKLYRRIKDTPNLERLESMYQKKRSKHQMPKIQEKVSDDTTQAIMSIIETFVAENDEEDIIIALFSTPHIITLENLKKNQQDPSREQFLSGFFPNIIIDKFGNTIARYQTKEELEEYGLIRDYGFSLQIATQITVEFFLEAFRKNKISVDGIVDVLKKTWVGRPEPRRIHGEVFEINYINLIKPGLISFFNELDRSKDDENYKPNFVCATDSLLLKAEYLIREMCRILNIKTFKVDRNSDVILERMLDDMLYDQKFSITEDDRFFIRYVLTEKAGYNLRNKVAHGLMDDIEYGIQNPILAIVVLLKLANYEIDNQKGDAK